MTGSGESWPRVDPATLADQVYEVVRDRTLSGALEPGEFVREQEVCEATGVSRTPVREALARLASEGFLERIPHRGFRVPDEPIERVLEIYPVLWTLEVLAVRTALPRMTEDDLAELRELNDRFRGSMEAEDASLGVELNDRFHQRFAEISGNRKLAELLLDLRDRVIRLERWSFSHFSGWEEAVEEHQALLEAVEAGDAERAAAVTERNRSHTYRHFLADLASPESELAAGPWRIEGSHPAEGPA